MKKYYLIFLLIVLLLVGDFLLAGSAVSLAGRHNLFLRAGYVWPAEDQLEGGPLFALGGTLMVSPNFGVEVEGRVLLLSSLYNRQLGLEVLGSGDLAPMGISGSLCYNIYVTGRLGLYFLAGLGYFFNHFSAENTYSDLGFEIEETVDSAISYHIGTGINLLIAKNLALNLEARYSLSNAGGEWRIEDRVGSAVVRGTTETDLNRLSIMMGVRLYL
jgi:hypothetical protein